ncbi:hydroxyethylthiazole kinase [Weissella oryzae SG25]|uniref:Hydroxyethylthiazole kinase n=1 Tax=Weissella oryzae (strain DSM 25784 / JCM 18191 / LMG 30913 / SG25) TaxID=1329250 RepID=A0A069CXX4_WEIOS|nr:hydroxyethylthiazole kinase [Weissella oryzae]GAK29916.1 hydroxyethylthiazole kinase [Weissella oryzae SG25]
MGIINQVREKQPLVLNLANTVTQQRVADVISYVGGSPLMTTASNELAELMQIASALVINIGTLNDELLPLYIEAGKLANQLNKPVILDPVAVTLPYRGEIVTALLKEIKVNIIRGNAAEIAWFANQTVAGKGIDALDNQINEAIVLDAAQKTGAIIVQSGPTDLIADGQQVIKITAHSDLFKINVGTGDMLSALIGTFSAVSADYFAAAVEATELFANSGVKAAQIVEQKPANFINALLDCLYEAN